MKPYSEMTIDELKNTLETEKARYEEFKARGISLDMSRGMPSKAQLDLSEGLLTVLSKNEDCRTEGGTDCRNYGCVEGIPEARKLMGELMGAPADQVIVCGNASLNIMFDTVSRGFTHGFLGSTPWSKLDKVKFLCPVPGYDRHFGVTEYFGVEMINIPMTDEGPDMDLVEKYVNTDPAVKGIWCVPKYSNPQGIVYSKETVERFSKLQPAAKDFRIFWDNAYALHRLATEPDERDELANILERCEANGNPDMVFLFASTSKITYAGAGIAAFASSKANVAEMKKHMSFQIISHDKINQLRHVKFFKDFNGMKMQMDKHAGFMRPKFMLVNAILKKELEGLGISRYTLPRGGYFISFDAMEGCAKKIVNMAKEAGLVLTGAGATFPYHNDPHDSNIRIAPSMPEKDELEQASYLFANCVKIASLEKLIAEKA
ncbi:MAG: aminotransferase [Lachnospiraceae bacterium]|nr:aminotransferase [Lachnospiraceae bacterium]